ncbi:hypothetical protein BFP76_08460 [Amylibacter kogurei]|uniref:SCP domain-containing protein n=1 Tax=Paramylibacter kogurei TaxID=1889778 RepID=A0A2G5K207_9RHOB|nr:CAP domain-containing protein [Amylibacter kogurei]PIB23053.1 hypothetical protein BFP76_08460 [Amylibacter kogurei]
MLRIVALIFASLMLVACSPDVTETTGDGTKVFRISAADENKIQFRHLDAVNAVRTAKGLQAVQLSPQLIAAAKTHSFDMSRQNRPWHFGSDGSSPIDRVNRAGYTGTLLGENISETFEGDLQTLNAWMADSLTREVIMEPSARYLGISWYQQKNGKIWWTQLMGN